MKINELNKYLIFLRFFKFLELNKLKRVKTVKKVKKSKIWKPPGPGSGPVHSSRPKLLKLSGALRCFQMLSGSLRSSQELS